MPIADVQITNKQHAVPQNFMDVEFKLVGDLTMRQFTYLMVFGGAAYISAVSVIGLFQWPLVIIFVIMGLGLAFVPIEERGMDQWVINFIHAVYSPNQKIWKKIPVPPSAFMYQNIAVVQQEIITLTPTSSRRKLEEYLEYQDKEVKEDRLDIPEKEFILKVREAFSSGASLQTSVIVEEPITSFQPMVTFEPAPDLPQVPEEQQKEAEIYLPVPASTSLTPVQKPPVPAVVPVKETLYQQQPVKVSQRLPDIQVRVPRKYKETLTLTPMTPDRHAGRRFVSLLPSQGEIVLPIRGERILKTSEEMEIEEDIQLRAEKLRKLINQIKSDEKDISRQERPAGSPVTSQTPAAKPQAPAKTEEILNKEAQALIESVKQENARLAQEIDKLKAEMDITKHSDYEKQAKAMELQKLQQEKARASNDYAALQNQIVELQSKLKEKEKVAPEVIYKQSSVPPSAVPSASVNKPNIISGRVRDANGNVMEGVLVIVKDEKNDPKRALKTNSLGQFALTTPLTNGIYTVEVGATPNQRLHFDIISVEAGGNVIPPVEFVGKL